MVNSIFYELHVKGFTQRHPEVPRELRGTYRGLVERPVLDHLHRLGVTAVELLPVHQFVHDAALLARGLRNFWGYQSIGYFAPHNEYASSGGGGEQVDDFKAMVRGLHDAGLEVILDVVFNHTAEGNENGPTLCFRGLDNGAYYRLRVEDPRRYAYCQDNDVSWVDWSLADEADDLTEFVAAPCRLRLATPMLHSRRFFTDRDLRWLRPDGEEMTEADWANRFARAVAVTASDGVILMLNGWWEPLSFRLPPEFAGVPLSVLVDTSVDGAMTRAIIGAGDLILAARSLMLVGLDDDRAAATVQNHTADTSSQA